MMNEFGAPASVALRLNRLDAAFFDIRKERPAVARKFENQVALITGASGGIGRATALAFAGEGAKVVVADIGVAGGEETVQLIQAAGGEATFVRTDVSKSADVEALLAATIATYGRIDVAFNNAGIEGQSALTADCTEENWDRVLGINLKGVWLCMKAEIPHMLAQGGGAIVNCASVAGLVGFGGIPAYTASKHGIVGLTKTAALDYATTGIRVNAVCPGIIRTAMIERFTGGSPEALAQMKAQEPVGRLGEPAEIASAVLWLASADASFVTGQAIAVDGGFVAR
jgi:NAD(P)-dependent dehydrogenase (short-subunit alcohol dehydrogenase family)